MTSTKRKFFSGPSLPAALVAAASEYGLQPEEIAYRMVEKRHGFLKVRRNVVIEVDPESPKRQAPEPEPARAARPVTATVPAPTPPEPAPPESPEQAPREPLAEPPGEAPAARISEAPPEEAGGEPALDDRPPLRPRQRPERGAEPARSRARPERPGGRPPAARPRTEPARAEPRHREPPPPPPRRREPPPPREEREPRARPLAERYPKAAGELADSAQEAIEWLLDLVDLDVDPTVYEGEDRFEIELRGPDRDVLVADNGKVLAALEHLVPRVMRGVGGESYPCRVDSESFQDLRKDRLRATAHQAAAQVRRHGRPEILEPMEPADRRVIHVTLADDPAVTTRSLGEGYLKRVRVLPR